MTRILLSLATAASASALFAKIELGAPFADSAVLQRDRAVPVWGRATPGNEISVAFADQEFSVVADAAGKWRVDLKPMPASSEGRVLRVTESEPGLFGSEVDAVEVRDVLVGEVWFASGQSNMECPIWGPKPRYRDGNGALVTAMTRLPNVRYCYVPVKWSVEPAAFRAKWLALTHENVSAVRFSAVAYYYARELYLALGIPIGIVDASCGGTNIDAWTPRCGYDGADASLAPTVNYAVKADWKESDRKGVIDAARQQPTVLWNGMVASWTPMAMRGFIWYQGCRNASEADLYCAKMHALYNGWSRAFENPSLKLYFVQLAPYSQNWTGIVAAQNRFVREEPNAAIAVTSDVGNFDDIHPNQKEIVAKRLAVHALKRDYGFAIDEDDSPVFRSASFKNGRAEVCFDHVRAWYVYSPDFSLEMPFELAGEDNVWHPAKIENFVMRKNSKGEVVPGFFLKDTTIVVRSESVPNPVKVRYLYPRRTRSTLYNEMSLPLGAFSSEDR